MPLDNIGSGNGLVPSASSHYLSQCWPRFMSPYGVTRPQWVDIKCVVPGSHAARVTSHCRQSEMVSLVDSSQELWLHVKKVSVKLNLSLCFTKIRPCRKCGNCSETHAGVAKLVPWPNHWRRWNDETPKVIDDNFKWCTSGIGYMNILACIHYIRFYAQMCIVLVFISIWYSLLIHLK